MRVIYYLWNNVDRTTKIILPMAILFLIWLSYWSYSDQHNIRLFMSIIVTPLFIIALIDISINDEFNSIFGASIDGDITLPKICILSYYVVDIRGIEQLRVTEWSNAMCEDNWIVYSKYVLFQNQSDAIMFKMAFVE